MSSISPAATVKFQWGHATQIRWRGVAGWSRIFRVGGTAIPPPTGDGNGAYRCRWPAPRDQHICAAQGDLRRVPTGRWLAWHPTWPGILQDFPRHEPAD